MTNDHYTVNKILEIIKHYHINMQNIHTLTKDIASVGVAQYGIEASMPKSEGGFSSVVENEVMRQIENIQFYADMKTDMKYLQDRWHRITDEREAQILSLRLDGYKVVDIAELLKMDKSSVYRTLEKIACQIKSYPQVNATDKTN